MTIYNNPVDNTIFSAVTDDGASITGIGNKDENGVVSDIDTFQFVDPNGNTTTVKLGNDSLINQVITDSGVVLTYDWTQDVTGLLGVHISAVAKNGLLRASVNIDLTINTTSNENGKRKRRNAHTFKWKESDSIGKVYNRTKRQTSPLVVKVPIDVKRCGQLTDALEVKARVLFEYEETYKGNTLTGVKWGQNMLLNANPTVGVGKYEIQIPNKPASDVPEVISLICGGISTALGHTCTVLSLMNPALQLQVCIGIASAIELLTFVVPGDSVPVLAACEAGFAAADVACNTLGASPGPGAPSLLDHICAGSSAVVDNFVNEESSIFVTPQARFSDGSSISSNGIKIDIPPGISYTASTIVLEDAKQSFVVESLYAIPFDPAPHQSYTVYFYYECGQEGHEVYMHIIGTDNYVDELTCPAVNSCNCCELQVPGAEALVKDIVTVKYNSLTGTTLYSSQLVLIF